MAEDIPETKFYNPVPCTSHSVIKMLLLTGLMQWNGASSARPTMHSQSLISEASCGRLLYTEGDCLPSCKLLDVAQEQNYYSGYAACLSISIYEFLFS